MLSKNDYLKISNSQWGRYRVKGYTKTIDGTIYNAVSPFNFYKDNELVASYTYPLTLRQGDTFTNTNGKVYRADTETTETAPSQMIPSGVTKITDANGVELEFEILNDNLNFSNRTLVGKATPTITAEKIISKGFTSAGTHYAQMYIYDDGEVLYVNNGNHATAYANGVWEIEYKTIKFDSGVELTKDEKETLLKIFN